MMAQEIVKLEEEKREAMKRINDANAYINTANKTKQVVIEAKLLYDGRVFKQQMMETESMLHKMKIVKQKADAELKTLNVRLADLKRDLARFEAPKMSLQGFGAVITEQPRGRAASVKIEFGTLRRAKSEGDIRGIMKDASGKTIRIESVKTQGMNGHTNGLGKRGESMIGIHYGDKLGQSLKLESIAFDKEGGQQRPRLGSFPLANQPTIWNLQQQLIALEMKNAYSKQLRVTQELQNLEPTFNQSPNIMEKVGTGETEENVCCDVSRDICYGIGQCLFNCALFCCGHF